jgi:hypothetical protein
VRDDVPLVNVGCTIAEHIAAEFMGIGMATHADADGEDATDLDAVVRERIEAGFRADLARIASSLRARSDFDDFDDQALEQVIEALKANQPAISDKDIRHIVDRMSERYIEKWENQIAKGSTRKRALERAREIAWGVIAGLITTGALDLMTYLAHSPGLHLESRREDASVLRQKALESQRKQQIQRKLLAGLPDTILRSFDEEPQIQEELRDTLYRRLTTTVRETNLMEDLVPLPSWDNGDPFPVADFVDILWWMVAKEVAHSIGSN